MACFGSIQYFRSHYHDCADYEKVIRQQLPCGCGMRDHPHCSYLFT